MKCAVCERETEFLDPCFSTDEGEEAYCADCLMAALRWGLRMWVRAGAPGAKKFGAEPQG